MEIEREFGGHSVISDYSRLAELLFIGLGREFNRESFIKAQQDEKTLQDILNWLSEDIRRYAKKNTKEMTACLSEFRKNGDINKSTTMLLKSLPLEVVQVMNHGLNIQNQRKVKSILKSFENNASKKNNPKNSDTLIQLSNDKCVELIRLMNSFTHRMSGLEVKSYIPKGNYNTNEDLNKMAEFMQEKAAELIEKGTFIFDFDRDYLKELEKCGFKLDDVMRNWLKRQPKELVRVIHAEYMLETEQVKYMEHIRLSHLPVPKFTELLLYLEEKQSSKEKLSKRDKAILNAVSEYYDNPRGAELKAKENYGQILTREAKRELNAYEEEYIASELTYNYYKGKKNERRKSLLVWIEEFEKNPQKAKKAIRNLIDKYKNETITKEEKFELSAATELKRILLYTQKKLVPSDRKPINQSIILLAKHYLDIIDNKDEKDLMNIIKDYLIYGKIEFVTSTKEDQAKIDKLVSQFIKHDISPEDELKLWKRIKKFLPYVYNKECIRPKD